MDIDKKYVLKRQDAVIEVLIVDPITFPIAKFFANICVHPLSVTAIAFASRVAAAVLFFNGLLYEGATLSIIGFLLDGVDGKVARIRKLDEKLHGIIDFVSDQVALGFMTLGLISYCYDSNQYLSMMLLCLWLVARMILMATISTWFRILSESGLLYSASVGESIFELVVSNNVGFFIRIYKNVGQFFKYIRSIASKYRMIPYLGAIESEVVVFMIAPFFELLPIYIIIGVLLLLPDLLVKLIPSLYKTVYLK